MAKYYYDDPIKAAWMGKYHMISFISHIIDDDMPLGSKITFTRSKLKSSFWRKEADKSANFFEIFQQMKEPRFQGLEFLKNGRPIRRRIPKNKRGKLFVKSITTQKNLINGGG